MKLLAAAATLALAPLAACTTGADDDLGRPSYYVMRHLHKAADGPDPPLSEVGRHNARHLISLLGSEPPRSIYASTTRRARETAQPAAEHWGLAIDEYDPRDTSGLVERVRKAPKPVLIIGHSNTVPAIVEALVRAQIPPIGEEEYGMLYALTEGEPSAIRMPVDPDFRSGAIDE